MKIKEWLVLQLYRSEKLRFTQKETIKIKLLSFGDWAVKFVKKHEAKSKESFNEEFCLTLEYHLCSTFRNSDQKEIRRLWCDGIVCDQFSKKYVNNNREIETIAWIGEEGQNEYDMKIKFGKYSLRRYAKGTEMTDCIPESDLMDWVEININKKWIVVQLK